MSADQAKQFLLSGTGNVIGTLSGAGMFIVNNADMLMKVTLFLFAIVSYWLQIRYNRKKLKE